jgi:hypothetical protein
MIVIFKILFCSPEMLITVPNYGEEVCADPGKGDATLGVGGPGPPARDSESQLVPDRGGGKT